MQKIAKTGLLLFAIFVLRSEAAEKLVANGQTVADVIQILGEPNGTVAKGKDTYLYYAGTTIKITGGVVTGLPANFNETLKSAQQKEAGNASFIREQKSKGLVLCDGAWITKDEEATKQKLDTEAKQKEKALRELTVAQQKQDVAIQKIKDQFGIGKTNKYGPAGEYIAFRKDGSKVDHRPLAIPDKVVVVIYTKNFGMCPKTSHELQAFLKSNPEIVSRRINFSSWEDPIVEQLSITWAPCIRVIDPAGRLIGRGTIDFSILREQVEQAKRQCGLGKYANP